MCCADRPRMQNEKRRWEPAKEPKLHVARVPAREQECPGHLQRDMWALNSGELLLLDGSCILASGMQWTVLCLGARNLGSGWEQQMWFTLSQWHWRELINTQLTGSRLMGAMLKAGYV